MFAIIDVETTGGSARYERITEIAIVLHDGEKVVDTFATLLNPERSIPFHITQLTGISDDMVVDAPRFFEIARRVVEMTEGAIFVAHNASFDYGFIKEEFARLGYEYSRKQLCTVRLARKVFPGLPSYSLGNLKAHFGIHSERAHRALDDTLATVDIFERILEAQEGKMNLRHLINYGVKASKLPPAITLERLHALPEACGVYYLHDESGEVIYVGKSLNIRKRIFEHFADQTPKGEKLRNGVADISFEPTGSELVALLLESAEIKRYQPRINRALRARTYQACIAHYRDQSGYLCFAVGKLGGRKSAKLEIAAEYPKLDYAKNHLKSLARQFDLCEKLCSLDFREHACFQYNLQNCLGACIGQEPVALYNERAAQALEHLRRGLSGSFWLIDQGRNEQEHAVVGVLEGRFVGFGYFDRQEIPSDREEVLGALRIPVSDPDAPRIIRSFLNGRHQVQVRPIPS